MISIGTNKEMALIGDIKGQEARIDTNRLISIYISIKIFFNQ